MKFEITDAKPMDKNTLKGLFSLLAGPLKIEGFTYHVKEDKSWIGFPAKEYTDKETGEKKYWPIVRIEDKDRYHAFQDWAKGQVSEIFKPDHDEGAQQNIDDDIPF
jgi:hypothetical protein